MSNSNADHLIVAKTIVVRQDVGGPFAAYRYATLELMADHTVRWRDPRAEDFPTPETTPQEYGGRA